MDGVNSRLAGVVAVEGVEFEFLINEDGGNGDNEN